MKRTATIMLALAAAVAAVDCVAGSCQPDGPQETLDAGAGAESP